MCGKSSLVRVSTCRVGGRVYRINRHLCRGNFITTASNGVSIGISSGRCCYAPANISGNMLAPSVVVHVSNGNGGLRNGLGPSSRVGVRLHICRRHPSIATIMRTRPPITATFAITNVRLSRCVLPRTILAVNGIPAYRCNAPSAVRVPSSLSPCLRGRSTFLLGGRNTLAINYGLAGTFFIVRRMRFGTVVYGRTHRLNGMRRVSYRRLRGLVRLHGGVRVPNHRPNYGGYSGLNARGYHYGSGNGGRRAYSYNGRNNDGDGRTLITRVAGHILTRLGGWNSVVLGGRKYHLIICRF